MCEDKSATPMDIAVERESEDMISLLAEFTEMPDPVKLFYLSKLMYKGENKAKEKKKFKNILSSLSVELVSLQSFAVAMHWLSLTFSSTRNSWNTSVCPSVCPLLLLLLLFHITTVPG